MSGMVGGTALKPSFEPIIVARKPFKGSLVDNVIEWGVGGINIDECRVGNEERTIPIHSKDEKEDNTLFGLHSTIQHERIPTTQGRFPANTILTYEQITFDEVCGGFPDTKTGSIKPHKNNANAIVNKMTSENITSSFNGDSGSAARYFMNCKYTGKDEEFRRYIYVPKASKKDRDEGLDEFEEKKTGELQGGRKEGSAGSIMLNADGTTRVNPYAGTGTPKKNIHPTVKPTELMQYLVRLVSPNGATILDPFMRKRFNW